MDETHDETLTITSLEKAREGTLEQHWRLRAPQKWGGGAVCKRGSVAAHHSEL